MREHRAGAALLLGENFYNFVKMFTSDAEGGGAGDGEGGTTDVTHWAWGAALGSFTQLNNLILWTQYIIEG